MISRGFTLLELLAVMVIASSILILSGSTIANKYTQFRLLKTIEIGKNIALEADVIRARPSALVRNGDSSVTATYGNIYPGEVTAQQFNTNHGTSIKTVSEFGTPYRITSTNFSTSAVVDIPIAGLTPQGASARVIPGGTELTITARNPIVSEQNKRIKWKKRVLYQETVQ